MATMDDEASVFWSAVSDAEARATAYCEFLAGEAGQDPALVERKVKDVLHRIMGVVAMGRMIPAAQVSLDRERMETISDLRCRIEVLQSSPVERELTELWGQYEKIVWEQGGSKEERVQ